MNMYVMSTSKPQWTNKKHKIFKQTIVDIDGQFVKLIMIVLFMLINCVFKYRSFDKYYLKSN